jgi:rhodanese-related sulfurtransferase
MTAAHLTPHDHDQDRDRERVARRAADRAFDLLNSDFDFRADSAEVAQHTLVQVNEDLLARGLHVGVAELGENDQELDEDRVAVVSQRAALARQRAAEEAFTTVNPDFGVLVDRDDPDQQSFARQREAALVLGVRAAAALRDEHQPDRQQRQTTISNRARTAAGRDRVDRLRQPRGDRPQPAAQRRPDRSHHRRSGDRRSPAEREEERSR